MSKETGTNNETSREANDEASKESNNKTSTTASEETQAPRGTIRKTVSAVKKIFRRKNPSEQAKHGRFYRRLEAMYSGPFFGRPPLYSAVMALIVLLVIEGFGYETPLGGLIFLTKNPFAFFLNFLIIFATLSVSWIFRRRWFVHSVLLTLWVVLGVINGVVLTTRMTPFTTADFAIMDLGIEMFSVYMTTTQTVIILIAAVVAIVIFTLMFVKAPRRKPWGGAKQFLKSLASVAISFVLMFSCWNIGTQTGFVATYFTNLWDAYTDYGMPYGFLSTWLRKGMSRPMGYSEQAVNAIFDKGELGTMTSDTEPGKTAADFPNIIFLQLESFIDPNEVKGLAFSQDPAPYFNELKQKYSSGHLTVPVVGGGTANTEFESMTGMSCREFGPGEYPYKSVLKDKAVESMAFDLKNLGYKTHAIHNHRAAFYNRNKVFSMLGFDDFTSIEYMNYVTKTQRGFATDDVLTGEILGALGSTEEHDYIYTISVQGHGEYPKKPIIKSPRITVEGADSDAAKAGWEFYLEQVNEMDDFLKVLTDELSEFDEDVVLVMYGDHLPALHMADEDMKSGDTFKTEYVIWSNFGLKKEDKDLWAYQVGAEVQKRVGLRQGLMTVFHQDKQASHAYSTDLHLLQYDILYGKDFIYGGQNPFKPSDMKMGYTPIKVKEVVEVEGEYYINGEGFTPFSKVSLDGNVLDTVYVGPTVLMLKDKVDPDSVKDMKVSQVEKYNEILSTTE